MSEIHGYLGGSAGARDGVLISESNTDTNPLNFGSGLVAGQESAVKTIAFRADLGRCTQVAPIIKGDPHFNYSIDGTTWAGYGADLTWNSVLEDTNQLLRLKAMVLDGEVASISPQILIDAVLPMADIPQGGVTPTLTTPEIIVTSPVYNQISIKLNAAAVSNMGNSVSYEVYIGGIFKGVVTGASWAVGTTKTYTNIPAVSVEVYIVAKSSGLSQDSNKATVIVAEGPTLTAPSISAMTSDYNQVSIWLDVAAVSSAGGSIVYDVYIGGALKSTETNWAQSDSRIYNGIPEGSQEIYVVARNTTNGLTASTYRFTLNVQGTGSTGGNMKIENMGLYYGWPSVVNNVGTISAATTEFAKFDILVFGDGLQDTSHGDHANTQQIMQNLKSQGKKVFGYIPLGVTGSADSLSMSQLKTRVDQWYAMSAYGIFLDEYGFDYGVTRARQNEIMDYIHNKGMYAIMNAWIPADACGDLNESGANVPPHITANDYYFLEDWILELNSIQSMSEWKAKGEACMAYRQSKGVGMIAFGTVDDPYSLGTNDSRFKLFKHAAAMFGMTAMQFTETHHSSSSGRLSLFPALTNFGTTFTDSITGTTTLTRHTDTGTITATQNGSTYNGSFA